MTRKQREMLEAFERDGEAMDLCDFDAAGVLDWRNRERVIDACRRRGWLDDDGITAAGKAALRGS
jgi:SOS response regulatory protein OraA/RecX